MNYEELCATLVTPEEHLTYHFIQSNMLRMSMDSDLVAGRKRADTREIMYPPRDTISIFYMDRKTTEDSESQFSGPKSVVCTTGAWKVFYQFLIPPVVM